MNMKVTPVNSKTYLPNTFTSNEIPLAKNKPELYEFAQNLSRKLKQAKQGRIIFENTGNIGKAYRRHDEIGTPFCITVDFDTIGAADTNPENLNTVTIRNRDSLEQQRVAVDDVLNYINQE